MVKIFNFNDKKAEVYKVYIIYLMTEWDIQGYTTGYQSPGPLYFELCFIHNLDELLSRKSHSGEFERYMVTSSSLITHWKLKLDLNFEKFLFLNFLLNHNN